MAEKRDRQIKGCFWTLLLLVIICLGILCMGKRVLGAEVTEKSEEEIMEEIKTHRDSIVRIEAVCWDGDEKVYKTKEFSGFVVSRDTTGIYVVTVHRGLTFSSEEKEKIRKEYELENTMRVSEKIEVVFRGDLRVQADIVGESDQRNLTVLRLDQSVNFENVLQFPEKSTLNKEQIFLLSYPGDLGQGREVYHTENVMITSGTILNFYMAEEITFLKHDIQTDEASVGGPLLNQEGLVVGLLLTSRGEKDGSAISCEALKSFLDTFNVKYEEYAEEKIVEKIPVLNLLLGFVILALLAAVVIQVIRGRAISEKGTEPESAKAPKKRTEKKKASNHGGQKGQGVKAKSASLEYPFEKRLVIINKELFVIGRTMESDFVLSESKGISRRHASIQLENQTYYLMDLNSTNHTFLNGSELPPGDRRKLRDGDEITVGKEKLIFHCK